MTQVGWKLYYINGLYICSLTQSMASSCPRTGSRATSAFLLPLEIFRGFHDYSISLGSFKDEQSKRVHERSVLRVESCATTPRSDPSTWPSFHTFMTLTKERFKLHNRSMPLIHTLWLYFSKAALQSSVCEGEHGAQGKTCNTRCNKGSQRATPLTN
jgi:hypothetical protein